MTEAAEAAGSLRCPSCGSEYFFTRGEVLVCTECAHEWTAVPQAPLAGASD